MKCFKYSQIEHTVERNMAIFARRRCPISVGLTLTWVFWQQWHTHKFILGCTIFGSRRPRRRGGQDVCSRMWGGLQIPTPKKLNFISENGAFQCIVTYQLQQPSIPKPDSGRKIAIFAPIRGISPQNIAITFDMVWLSHGEKCLKMRSGAYAGVMGCHNTPSVT